MAQKEPANDSEGHDAQRALEQKALRNVRGLVDRIQADEEMERQSRKWIVGLIAAVVVLLLFVWTGLVLVYEALHADTRSNLVQTLERAEAATRAKG